MAGAVGCCAHGDAAAAQRSRCVNFGLLAVAPVQHTPLHPPKCVLPWLRQFTACQCTMPLHLLGLHSLQLPQKSAFACEIKGLCLLGIQHHGNAAPLLDPSIGVVQCLLAATRALENVKPGRAGAVCAAGALASICTTLQVREGGGAVGWLFCVMHLQCSACNVDGMRASHAVQSTWSSYM